MKIQKLTDKQKSAIPRGRQHTFKMKNSSYSFVLTVEDIAGGTVKEGCAAAVELSRNLKCMVKTEINNTVITACGDVMTAEDAYELWKQQNSKDSKSGDILLSFFIFSLIAIGVISTYIYNQCLIYK